jgi:hypothetical protein
MEPYEITKVTCDWSSIRVEITGPEGIAVFVFRARDIMKAADIFEKILFIPHPPIEDASRIVGNNKRGNR